MGERAARGVQCLWRLRGELLVRAGVQPFVPAGGAQSVGARKGLEGVVAS